MWFYNAEIEAFKELPESAQPMVAQSGWFPSDPPPPPVEVEANAPAELVDEPAPEVAAPEADPAPVAEKKSPPRPAKES